MKVKWIAVVLLFCCGCAKPHAQTTALMSGFKIVSYSQELDSSDVKFTVINGNLTLETVCLVPSPLAHCDVLKAAVGTVIPATNMQRSNTDTLAYNPCGLESPCGDRWEFLTIIEAKERAP